MSQKKSGHPSVYVIAGPNGAGKTTFAREFLPAYADCKNFVNADLIAQGVSPFSPESAAIKAGKLMLNEIESFAQRRADFGFETSLLCAGDLTGRYAIFWVCIASSPTLGCCSTTLASFLRSLPLRTAPGFV